MRKLRTSVIRLEGLRSDGVFGVSFTIYVADAVIFFNTCITSPGEGKFGGAQRHRAPRLHEWRAMPYFSFVAPATTLRYVCVYSVRVWCSFDDALSPFLTPAPSSRKLDTTYHYGGVSLLLSVHRAAAPTDSLRRVWCYCLFCLALYMMVHCSKIYRTRSTTVHE